MKEFELTMRLRNNLLKRRRLELGLTPKQLAEQVPMSYPAYLDYEGLRLSPLRTDGVWKRSALSLAEFHGAAPGDLWPEVVLVVNKPELTTELSADAALALGGYARTFELPPTPEELLIAAEREAQIQNALDDSNWHRQILKLRVKGKTLSEIGSQFALSRERVRQLQLRALAEIEKETKQNQAHEQTQGILRAYAVAFACPVCKAEPGKRCRTKRGDWAISFHKQRFCRP